MYDIIGDIHGHASRLESLLQKLGYDHDGHSWRHPERHAIFLGDFIDRGPEQVETYELVRRMIERGSALAVMGNHEFNAVAFKTPHPDHPDERLRPHSEKNRQQHAAFLDQVGQDSDLHDEMIAWFKTLPLYLDLEGLRVVHACWHDRALETPGPLTDDRQRLTERAWPEVAQKGSEAYEAVETVLKGLEIPLPDGATFLDKERNERRHIRMRWWEEGEATYRSIAMMDEQTRATLPDEEVPTHELPGYQNDKPVFVGHYWLRGTPQPMSSKVACVDYTVTEPLPTGKLTAYRWDGLQSISGERFVWV